MCKGSAENASFLLITSCQYHFSNTPFNVTNDQCQTCCACPSVCITCHIIAVQGTKHFKGHIGAGWVTLPEIYIVVEIDGTVVSAAIVGGKQPSNVPASL